MDGSDQDDLDAGVAPEVALRRRADAAAVASRVAGAELGRLLDDDQVWQTYGLDMAELRRGPDAEDVDWTLP